MPPFHLFSSTAISFEDDENKQSSSKEQIVENIRLHKEVLQSVKYQTWSMRRKLRLVRQVKSYVARHEGALQERYAKSRNTRDLWARFKLLVAAVGVVICGWSDALNIELAHLKLEVVVQSISIVM